MSGWGIIFITPWIAGWMCVVIWWWFRRKVDAEIMTMYVESKIDQGGLDG